MKCWIFHKWTKWSEQFKVTIVITTNGITGTQDYQKRICMRCGKQERRRIT